MANVRPQRAAIEELLAHSKHAVLVQDTVVTTTVHRKGRSFHVTSIGVSSGDTCYNRFKDIPVVVFHRSSRSEAACISAGAACVLDEPVQGGAENERRVCLLRPVAHNGTTVFRATGKSVTYREV